jgi:hypothetical protein
VFSVQWAQGICEISILATLTVIRFKAKRPRMLNAERRTPNAERFLGRSNFRPPYKMRCFGSQHVAYPVFAAN